MEFEYRKFKYTIERDGTSVITLGVKDGDAIHMSYHKIGDFDSAERMVISAHKKARKMIKEMSTIDEAIEGENMVTLTELADD